jgi:hypothetical protein
VTRRCCCMHPHLTAATRSDRTEPQQSWHAFLPLGWWTAAKGWVMGEMGVCVCWGGGHPLPPAVCVCVYLGGTDPATAAVLAAWPQVICQECQVPYSQGLQQPMTPAAVHTHEHCCKC